MKKLLLAAACVLGLSSLANAAEITLTPSEITKYTETTNLEGTYSVQGITFSAEKNSGATAPAYNKSGDLRLYANNTMTVAAPEGVTFEKMVFTLSANGLKRACAVTATPGTIATQAAGDTEVTWSGSAASITYSVGEKSIYGTDGETKAGQFDWEAVTITYTGTLPEAGDDPVTPTPTPTGAKFELASEITSGSQYALVVNGQYGAAISATATYGRLNMTAANISDNAFYAAASNAITITEVAGKGYTLVDAENRYMGMDSEHLTTFQLYTEANDGCYWTAAFSGNDLTLTNTLTNCIVCQSGTYTNIAPAVVADGQTLPQLYKMTEEGGETPAPTVTTVKSVKEIIALNSGDKFEADFTFTVGWVSNKNIFACDENGDFIQIYNENALVEGDVIAKGLTGTYELYNGSTPEITNATIPAATAGTFTPAVVAAADITVDLVNSVVMVENVVLAEASPADKVNFEATSDGVTLNFRNNYTLESVPAGTYNITVVVNVYNNEPTLYVTHYYDALGIADVEAENAPVEYFNLQGIRVDNPENGLFIRRQGNKVSKVAL